MTSVTMAQHNASAKMDDVQRNTDKIATKYMSAFPRRKPLISTPKRKYIFVFISPWQKQNGCQTASGVGIYETPSPIATNIRFEEFPRTSDWHPTLFEPFSFDQRDAARKVARERRLRELQQEQLRFPVFKANPVRKYKPLNRPQPRINHVNV